MDSESYVFGPRARRAVPLIAAALAVIVVGGLLYLHPTAAPGARFVGVPPPPEVRSAFTPNYDFVDSQHGWASVRRAGGTSTISIFRTTDGAHSWHLISNIAFEEQVQSIHFWDRTNGILQAGRVYTTSDGGSHWTLISLPDGSRTYVFASPRKGWAIDAGRVFATDDGGLTWQMRGLIPAWSGVYSAHGLRAIDFGATGEGWVGGVSNEPVVHSSPDGGATWTAHLLPIGKLAISGGKPLLFEISVRMLRGGAVFAWVRDDFGNAQSFVSSDGGLTWKPTRLPWPDPNQALAYMSFIGLHDWWASSNGSLERTTDGGRTWKSITTDAPPVLDNMAFGPIHMLDTRFGWAVVENGWGEALVTTSDGGAHLTLANVP